MAHDRRKKTAFPPKTLHRILGFGSYTAAWAMLHRFQCGISNAGHELLSGQVEVDETVFGGVRHGKPGRGAEGEVLVALAMELLSPKGFGRCRLQIIPNAETETLKAFVQKHIKTGSTIYTDGLTSSNPSATKDEYPGLKSAATVATRKRRKLTSVGEVRVVWVDRVDMCLHIFAQREMMW